jgi:oligoribonuclease
MRYYIFLKKLAQRKWAIKKYTNFIRNHSSNLKSVMKINVVYNVLTRKKSMIFKYFVAASFLMFFGLSLSYTEKVHFKSILNKKPQLLVWLGYKTTGFNPEKDTIQELAVIVTDSHLEVIAQSPLFVVNDSTLEETEMQILDFIKQYTQGVPKPYLCGSDRIMRVRFLMQKHMPTLEAYFSTVTLGSFSIREFCRLWNLDFYSRTATHSALEDAHEALAEATYYKERYLYV